MAGAAAGVPELCRCACVLSWQVEDDASVNTISVRSSSRRVGDDVVAPAGDVAERPSLDQRRSAFNGLHEIGQHRVALIAPIRSTRLKNSNAQSLNRAASKSNIEVIFPGY